MRYQRNIFLAGATALAFVAAVGFASAQETSPNHKAKEPQATTQPAQPGMGKQSATQNGKASERVGATTTTKGVNSKAKGIKHAQRVNRGKKTAKAHMRTRRGYAMRRHHMARYAQQPMHRQGTYAQQRMHGKARYAEQNRIFEQNRRLRGLQGNAAMKPRGNAAAQPRANGPVTLSAQQRTTIRNRVFAARNAPKVNQASFAVAVGTVIPRRFHIAPVPRTLAQIDPAWRGLRYFVFQDEVVIVNPHNFRIVAVVPV